MLPKPADLTRADELAETCIAAWDQFEKALSSNKRKYPLDEFKRMFVEFENYVEERKNSIHIHREIARFVSTAHEYLVCERKNVPDYVFKHSQRMSYMLFNDYNPLTDFEDCEDDD